MLTFFAALAVLISQSPVMASDWPADGWYTGIIERILPSPARRAQTSFAIAVIDRHTGESLWTDGFRASENVYPASMMKALVAFSVLQKIDRAEASLEDAITINQSNADIECGMACNRFGIGATRTVAQLLSAMLIMSNNIATNQLIDVVTKEEIARTAEQLGATGIQVLRKVYVRVNPEPEILERNRGTAAAFVELYREVISGRLGLLTETSRAHLQRLLGLCHSHSRLNAEFSKSVTFFHKTGSTSTSSGDAGYYFLDDDRAVIMAGMHDFRAFRPLQILGKAVLEMFTPSQ